MVIRFRAKDKNGIWVYGGINDCSSAILRNNTIIPVRPETVGQATALKDHDGNAIYEGDLVSLKGSILRVKRYKAAWIVDDLCNLCLNDLAADDLYVVGNVYDNPEYGM